MSTAADITTGLENFDFPGSEAALRALVDTIPQLAWMSKSDGYIFWYNRQWHEYTGTTPEQMQGWGWETVHDPELLPSVVRRWKTSLATGAPFEMEFPLRGADGTYRWFLTRVNPLRDAEGRIIRWCGTNTDIHDQRQARLDAEFLASVSAELNGFTGMDEIMASVGARIGRYLDLSHVNFVEVDEAAGIADVTHDWSRDGAASLVGRYDLSEYFSEEFAAAGRAGSVFVVSDVDADPRTDAEKFAEVGLRSFVCVPLIRDGAWRFACNIHDSKPRNWGPREIELVRELGNRIFLRVERARVEDELRSELANTERLRALSVQLGPVDPSAGGSLYEDVLDAAIDLTNAEAGTIQSVDEPSGSLELLLMRGLPDHFLERFGKIDGTSLTSCSRALVRRERVIVDFEEDIEDHDGSRQFHRDAGILAAQSTPLITRSGQLIGMISTHWRRRYFPDERQLRLLDLLARQVADLIEQRRSQEKLAGLLALTERQSRIFNTTLSGISDFAYIFDREGRFRYANKGLLDLLQLSLEEIVGKNYFDLNYPPDLAARLEKQIQYVIDTRSELRDEAPFTDPMGRSGFYEYIFRPVIDEAGEVEAVAGSTRDVTESRQRSEELRQAHAQLEERVAERTAELGEAVLQLKRQMDRQSVLEAERSAALKRLITIQEDERARIARDLHDQLGQEMTGLRLQITNLKGLCDGNEELLGGVTRVEKAAEKLDQEISFAAWAVRPSILKGPDFIAALRAYVEQWSAHYKITAHFQPDWVAGAELGPEVETNLYRILQEALNNAAKHANATEISIILNRRGDSLALIVEDNGKGFDARRTENGVTGSGFGLVGMRDRAALLSGTLEIESARNQGTTIFVRIPIQPDKGTAH